MSKFQQAQIEQLNAELEFSADAFSDSTDKWTEMYSSLQTDRDEWKRRALEAEEALEMLTRWTKFELVHSGNSTKQPWINIISKVDKVLNSINSGIPATDIEAE